MTALVVQRIRPAGARVEIFAMVATTLAVVAFLLFRVLTQGQREDVFALHDWQVSAFQTLGGADQAIYNALYTAKDEIVYIYDDINLMNGPGEVFRWPAIQDLQEFLLPPFMHDSSWQQNGAMQWRLHEPLAEGEMQGSVMYLGTGGGIDGQGSFLLVIGHVHAGFMNNNSIVIWWNQKNTVEMPRSGYPDSLILQGWREVVPHSGAREMRRIFGAGAAPEADDSAVADQLAQDLFGD